MCKPWIVLAGVCLLIGVAWAVQIPGGGYDMTGYVQGTSEAGEGEPEPQSGTMSSVEWGDDYYEWDEENDRYKVYDGGREGPLCGHFKISLTEESGVYTVEYFDGAGNPVGSGVWTDV